VSSTGKPAGVKSVPLVNADDDLASALSKAEALIEGKDYETAIELLRVLVDRTDGSGVIRLAGGARYVSLRIKANEVIGRMPPQGLKVYRGLFDPQARQWYEQAMATGDVSLLRRIVDRRLHSSFGARSLDALGSIYFDHGQFVLAARYWSRLLETGSAGDDEPLLLAKLAVARHLAGNARQATEAVEALRNKHRGAKGVLGGRDRDLGDFIEEVFKLAPVRSGPARSFRDFWPGLGGIPGGVGAMAESDVVLAGRWRSPKATPQSDLEVKLIVSPHTLNPSGNPNMRSQARLRDGRVEVVPAVTPNAMRGRFRARGIRISGGKYTLPTFIHPVIVGDTVYYRRDDAIIGCDIVTGRERCKADRLPVFRPMRRAGSYYSGYAVKTADSGRYGLTVGGGKLFAVANFRRNIRTNVAARVRSPEAKRELADTSTLVALSIRGQLKLLWRTSDLHGDETVRDGKFLCAPTYDKGRLYVIATHLGNYYLLCLSAESGKLIWKTLVSQTPTLPRRYGYSMDSLLHRGSPPALADGRVFVTTNGGVVAAFDAETGQIIWAYQYKSHYDSSTSISARFMGYSSNGIGVGYPANPVIATSGRVVSLPVDSDELLVLSTEDGRLLAGPDRRSLADLSAVDSDRVAMSGPGLMVLDLSDGSTREYPLVRNVVGRPAITPAAILASGKGRIYRLDLQTGAAGSTMMTGGSEVPGLLGELVSVRGVLIAANGAGICSYMSYNQAHGRLTERLSHAATPRDRAPLLMRRGQFAFSGKRFAEALDDLLAAEKLTRQYANVGTEMAGLRSLLHRTYVAIGNHAHRDPTKMLAMFVKADAYAKTVQEKAHMKIRIAKAYVVSARKLQAEAKRKEQAGDPAAVDIRRRMLAALVMATKTVQEIVEDDALAKEELVDTVIGAKADDLVRFGPDAVRTPARKLVLAFIDGLIDEFGRECYVAFDDKALAALKLARGRGDPKAIAAVADLWPNSVWADQARLDAAKTYYREGIKASGETAAAALAQAVRQLARVASESSDKQMRLSAHVGLASIYALGGGRYVAGYHCDRARELATDEAGTFHDTQVAFADRKGLLSKVLDEVRGEVSQVPRRKLPVFAMIDPPLHKVLDVAEKDFWILRDQEYRPIRIGQQIVALRGDRLVMIDPSSRNLDRAVVWVGLTGIKASSMRQGPMIPGTRLTGGLSADESILAVADREILRGFDVQTAKAKWSRTMREVGIVSLAQMGVGDGSLVAVDNGGRIVCVDLRTGEKRWGSRIPAGGNRRPSCPLVIEHGLVFVRHNSHRSMFCLDLKTGKAVRTWRGALQARVAFAESGLLVVLIDGKLSVFDPTRMSKPLWERDYNRNTYPAVLAVSKDFVAVSTGFSTDVVEVLAMTGGRKLADLSTSVRGKPEYPAAARFDGKNLYVVCTLGRTPGARQNRLGRLSMTRGMSLHKFTIGRGPRSAWRFVAERNPASMMHCLPLSIGKKHVVLTAKAYNNVGQTAVFVLDAESGKQAGKFPLVRDNRALAEVRPRLYSVGPPVMTNGQLCVETAEGMTIYGD